jgi:hypothetical protein
VGLQDVPSGVPDLESVVIGIGLVVLEGVLSSLAAISKSNLVMGTAGLVGLDNVSSRLPFLGNLVLSGLLGLGGVS